MQPIAYRIELRQRCPWVERNAHCPCGTDAKKPRSFDRRKFSECSPQLAPEGFWDGGGDLERRQSTQGSSCSEGLRAGQVDPGQQEREHTGKHFDLVRTAGVHDHSLVGALRTLGPGTVTRLARLKPTAAEAAFAVLVAGVLLSGFGPVPVGVWAHNAVFWAGPILGAAAGVLLYSSVFAPPEGK